MANISTKAHYIFLPVFQGLSAPLQLCDPKVSEYHRNMLLVLQVTLYIFIWIFQQGIPVIIAVHVQNFLAQGHKKKKKRFLPGSLRSYSSNQ